MLMRNKGFTTDVTCEFQDLTTSVTVGSDTIVGWNTGKQLGQVNYWQLDSNDCGMVPVNLVVNQTYAFTVDDPNYLLMIACRGASDNFCKSNLQVMAYLMLAQR